jgi:hypothetical protein
VRRRELPLSSVLRHALLTGLRTITRDFFRMFYHMRVLRGLRKR